MLLLYSLMLLVLGLARWFWAKRASALARKYTHFSTQLFELAREPARKPGNGNPAEASLVLAKRHFELGKLVQKRDALETRYLSWQASADRLGRWLDALRSWKGKKLPYTLGALDVWLALSVIDMLGFGHVANVRTAMDWALSFFQ